MPPDSVIIPPVPTIPQGSDVADISQNVSDIFDQVMPDPTKSKRPVQPEKPKPLERPALKEQAKAPTAPVQEPSQPITEPTEPKTEKPQQPTDDHIPSSIQDFLDGKVDPALPEATQDFPEELPTGDNGEGVKSNWKRLRDAYKNATKEIETLKSKPATDPAIQDRLKMLESDNKTMAELLQKSSIEHHADFQQKVIQPMHAAWNEAVRVVKEAGADPQELQRVLSLTGKAQYEALDQLFEGMPESAKSEATAALRSFKHYNEVRKNALGNPTQTAEQLRRADTERQLAMNKKQRESMDEMYTNAVNLLRDKGKVPLLMKVDSPEAKWWNDQADEIVNGGRDFFLNNTDMNKVAISMVMSRMVDPLMKLWRTERDARLKSDKIIKERLGSEPSLSESGGNVRGSGDKPDFKEPFHKAFIRELHRQEQGSGRR